MEAGTSKGSLLVAQVGGGGGEKGSGSGCVLKVKVVGLADILDLEYKRKKKQGQCLGFCPGRLGTWCRLL